MTQTESVGARRVDTTPNIVVRALWFVLIGWWATGIWLSIAWLLNVTIIGIPLGIKMINYTPKVVALKGRTAVSEVVEDGQVTHRGRDQHSLLLRAVYFFLIGWWLSGIWTGLAYLATVSIVGLPIAIWMYGKLPFVVSLYRY